jgi:AhpD family alkylhydroperoxidase
MAEQNSPRIDLFRSWPDGYRAVRALESTVSNSGLDPILMELVRTRASQINGCAYCIDMHTKDARARGETEQRLYGLSAWHETPFFTERERAALALTEAITLVAGTHVPEKVMDQAARWFSTEDLSKLVTLIATINVWNRFALAARLPVGNYESHVRVAGDA